MTAGDPDDGDGVQYDTFNDPSPSVIEAEEIRRECAEDDRHRHASRRDTVIVTRPY